jgi:hypothetical protein
VSFTLKPTNTTYPTTSPALHLAFLQHTTVTLNTCSLLVTFAMDSSIPNILLLPLELFRDILAQAMLVRGIKRALRLRLVHRTLNLDLMYPVAEYKMR